MSEELIIQHCSPTLAGIKTGNMFTCEFEFEEDIRNDIRALNRMLVPKGVRVLPLRFFKQRVLIYIYRPAKLKKDFANYHANILLRENGYYCECPERCVAQIANKLKVHSEFSHEIGLFLGYPPEDVQGFIENKAEDCKCIGCWKVYGDEENAKKLFEKYRKCTAVYFEQWENHKSVEQLTVAV